MTSFPSEYTPTGAEKGGGKFSPADILFKYLAFLPLFILVMVVSVGGGLLYLRYTTPKFVSGAQMLIKSGEENQVYGKGGDIVERALYGPRDINMANEIQKLRSVEVVTKAVVKNNLHIQYFNEGNIKTSNLYNKVPFRLVPVLIADSNRTYKVRFTNLSPAGYDIMFGEEGREPHQWKDVLTIENSQFRLDPISAISVDNAVNIATWGNPVGRATEILNELSIYQADPNTTILSLGIKNDNPFLGRAILDALIQQYIIYSVETKNIASEATIEFIEDRLDSLTKELAVLEGSLQASREQNEVMSISDQASMYSSRLSAAEEQIAQLDWQLETLRETENYIRSSKEISDKVPSTFGLQDATLNALISTFNALRVQKATDSDQLQPAGLLMQQLESQIKDVQQDIFESIRNVRQNLLRQKADVLNKSRGYRSYLSRIPDKQRRMLEIERQQKVKESLYLYLLQRKEEIAITTASTAPSYEAMNKAGGSLKPVEPDEDKIRMFTILLGLLLPIGIIYVKDVLNDKVYTRDDIQKKTSAPIIGEIGHVEDNKNLVVAHQSRNIISEQFRIVRSNLGFFLKEKPFQTILVTSTVSGEGKSFISINLAAVLALSGKKVALLEFDLRRPRIIANLGIQKSGHGISNILLGMSKPEDVFVPLENFPNLHIYPSGIVPPNPAELMLSESNKEFLEYIRQQYDYIIIDSAPVGLVSDTFSLAPFVDTSIYIVRHRFTFKRQMTFVQEIYDQKKLPQMWLVVNDLKMGARFGYYGYGYGYGKGYGYGYGYYYGYGRGDHGGGAQDYYDIQVSGWRRWIQRFGGGKRSN